MSLPGEKTDYHVAEMAASDCSSEKGECSQSTSSLLGRLKFPEPSELARKREVKANPPVRVKRSQRRSLLISIADARCEGEFGLTVWFFIENNRWLSWE